MLEQHRTSFNVSFRFSPELCFFLQRADRTRPVHRILREKTSIKDAIEACGVPHPEVNLIHCDGVSVSFEHHLVASTEIEVFGLEDGREGRLQERCVKRFVVDGHLGKLARDLRLLGFDVAYDPMGEDAELVRVSGNEERALLTRDRRLLMHKVVRHGYCPRSDDPAEQVVEVGRRFHLSDFIAPYTRCLHCNGLLQPVAKGEVIDQLEPLTRLYYEKFRRCAECGKIYWSGSHFGKLQARLEKIRARLMPPPA